MGTNDNSGEGFYQTRPPLADVTNRPAKRPFSLFSGEDEDSQFAKQMRLGVESSAKNKGKQLQFGAQTNLNNEERVMLQQKGKHPILDLDSFEFAERGEGVVPADRAVESGDKDVCGVDNLGSPECGAMPMPTFSASRDSSFLGLKLCPAQTGDGGASSVTDAVDIKSCTCSFCSKAGYIWSDLHYQDAKGRLSVIKKSQKEAKAIVQKISGLEDTVMHGQHQSEESLKLELSLVNQWKALFVQMQNRYAQEYSQLESSFDELKELREKCKNDLELNDDSNRENQ